MIVVYVPQLVSCLSLSLSFFFNCIYSIPLYISGIHTRMNMMMKNIESILHGTIEHPDWFIEGSKWRPLFKQQQKKYIAQKEKK